MKQQEFIQTLQAGELERLKKICTDNSYKPTADDATLYMSVIQKASDIWGEDQVLEAVKYIIVSAGGLRPADLQTLIGEDWKADPFCEFVNALGFPLLGGRQLMPGMDLYIVNPPLREELLKQMSSESRRSFSSDIAYHLISLPEKDPLRMTQAMHLLLDSDLPYEAARYISEAEGENLRIAIMTLGHALKDAPEEVRKCVWDMTDVIEFNREKLFLILLNDVMGILANPQLQQPVIHELESRIEGIVRESNSLDFGLILGIAKLRQAQNARLLKQEKEAQNYFISAVGGIMRIFEHKTAAETTTRQLDLLWLALRICQEMMQPKAIALLFDTLVPLENKILEGETDAEQKALLLDKIMTQHIEMSKLYHALPQPLQEEFKNYAEPTIELLQSYLTDNQDNGENKTEDAEKKNATDETVKRASLYQALGEICLQNNRIEDSLSALIEAQILQERLLGQTIKLDKEKLVTMSPDQLMARLSLSVTNHLLGIHYRRERKKQYDLKMVLETNMQLAKDCFAVYPKDGRVIHFLINATLEVGDYYHTTNSLIPEKQAYLYSIEQIQKIQNVRIDETLCRDVAMLHAKAGQAQMHFREFKEAKKNLSVSSQLWTQLFNNTQRPEFQKNLEAVNELLKQLK